jgi:hypothetical protein
LLQCSTNGTYINETLIGKGNKSMLTHGDQLSLVMSVSNRPDGTQQPLMDRPTPHSEISASSFPTQIRYLT